MAGEIGLPAIDMRLATERHGEMSYEMPQYATLEAWEQRATWLREHLLISLGLWPLPERTPLQTQMFGRIVYEDYTMEKVCFESWPGFYCTGNLFRPLGINTPCPGILKAHGHHERGRLEHTDRASTRALCVTLARMGMVAFAYDMVGYNDSLQVPRHRFASLRGSLWGLFPMALQTWNSIRAVDFLKSLPEVDPERIGCTGASGGGTQTYMVTAVDDRIKVAAPVNMISAHYQGGCVCENAPGLRIDTYNVEIAALAAPRPMLMVSATGDWTVNTPTVEYPAVRSIYRLYNADDHLAWAQEDAEHNYNAQSREHVYRWFARWFLGDEEMGRGAERSFAVEPDEQMRIFPTGHPQRDTWHPSHLEIAFRQAAERRLEALAPTDKASLERLRSIASRRLEHVLGTSAPTRAAILWEQGARGDGDGWAWQEIALGRAGAGDRISATYYRPNAPLRSGPVLLVHDAGQEGLRDALGEPHETLRSLLEAAHPVLVIDPFQGPRNNDWFWLTFNRTLLGHRVQDIITAATFLRSQEAEGELALVGLGRAGPWALLAAALSPLAQRVCADMHTLDAQTDDAYLGELYAPLLRAYGGLEVASALLAPRRLLLANREGRFPTHWARAAYRAAGVPNQLSEALERLDHADLVYWLGETRTV